MIDSSIMQIRISIGSDHRGKEIMNLIYDHLSKDDRYFLNSIDEDDLDCIDYTDIGASVARQVSLGSTDFGILICGNGIGMCVVANKFPGVRAAPCHNEVAAELSRKHNNSNILCLSGDMLGERSSLSIVEKWLSTPFDQGRHQDRLDKIHHLEQRMFLASH